MRTCPGWECQYIYCLRSVFYRCVWHILAMGLCLMTGCLPPDSVGLKLVSYTLKTGLFKMLQHTYMLTDDIDGPSYRRLRETLLLHPAGSRIAPLNLYIQFVPCVVVWCRMCLRFYAHMSCTSSLWCQLICSL